MAKKRSPHAPTRQKKTENKTANENQLRALIARQLGYTESELDCQSYQDLLDICRENGIDATGAV